MDNNVHMIGAYATFIFMIFLAVMPYFVIKYVKKKGRKTPTEKDVN
ncbi:hypothetical protein [Nitrosophilus kaiyonis]|nr:hypothetical protein [Nitrosophilus kaiyonis]